MVCGYGEQAGYETLVQSLAKASIDKSSRFTDWSLRPLTEKQLAYALSDVTHLRTVYGKLKAMLDANARHHWLESEMRILADPATYRPDPRGMWRRFKLRSPKPRTLAVLRELAAWRELAAQQRDIPRNRMLRDEALTEIAAHPPRTADELARTRGLSDGLARGRTGQEILAAVARGLAVPDAECPRLDDRPDTSRASGAVVELLKVLLRMRADEHGVAPKLIAAADDLERIALDDEADVPALAGWRREIFGADAIDLKHGRLALAVTGARVRAIPRPDA
jgi:ribonuclease D